MESIELTLEKKKEHSDIPINIYSLTISGTLPHGLNVKVGCIVVLIRNPSVSDGLCNETSLRVLRFECMFITAKIIICDQREFAVNISRI